MSPWILIADDDEDIREMVGLVLQARGYEAVDACDGQAALDMLAARGPPALIVLDLMMPRLCGEAFVQRMREHAELRDVPIVVLSGDNYAERLAAHFGAEACLTKPVDLEELVGTVARLVAGSGARARGASDVDSSSHRV